VKRKTKMAELKAVEIKTEVSAIPSLPVLPLETPPSPQAETVIQAAIQTGASAERAEKAALEAKESLSEADRFLSKIQKTIREEMSPLQARLKALEEPITPDEEGGTGEIVSANAVTIAEPAQSLPKLLETKQVAPPERKSGGGFLRRTFLNS
jgi:hypothetical protein